MNNKKIDTNHDEKRKLLRTLGPVFLSVGALFLIIGMTDFFSSFNAPFGGGPKLFWCNFIALPLLFVGAMLTSAGYMGAAARYEAEEIAPVAKDVISYLAEETRESLEIAAKSISAGTAEAENKGLLCMKCSKANPETANFCSSCGAALQRKKKCSNCGCENSSSSNYCSSCGFNLSS